MWDTLALSNSECCIQGSYGSIRNLCYSPCSGFVIPYNADKKLTVSSLIRSDYKK